MGGTGFLIFSQVQARMKYKKKMSHDVKCNKLFIYIEIPLGLYVVMFTLVMTSLIYPHMKLKSCYYKRFIINTYILNYIFYGDF